MRYSPNLTMLLPLPIRWGEGWIEGPLFVDYADLSPVRPSGALVL